MVDSNFSRSFLVFTINHVQIPLWSIVTLRKPSNKAVKNSSNSSMVDSNSFHVKKFKGRFHVQIPLWSIVTIYHLECCFVPQLFKFLYGR